MCPGNKCPCETKHSSHQGAPVIVRRLKHHTEAPASSHLSSGSHPAPTTRETGEGDSGVPQAESLGSHYGTGELGKKTGPSCFRGVRLVSVRELKGGVDAGAGNNAQREASPQVSSAFPVWPSRKV